MADPESSEVVDQRFDGVLVLAPQYRKGSPRSSRSAAFTPYPRMIAGISTTAPTAMHTMMVVTNHPEYWVARPMKNRTTAAP